MSNTENGTASSPPSFMQKVDDASTAATRAAEREAIASDKDAMEKRTATLVKAASRLSEQAEYLGRIDNAIAGCLPEFIAVHPLGEALDRFIELEAQVDAVDAAFKKIKERISFAREVSFPARMDAEESKTATSKDSGNRITRTARLFASILPSQDGSTIARAYEWLRNNNLGSLIKETVNSSSLNAAAKELMENGHELPDDIFRVHMKDGVSITKGKKK